MRVVSQSLMSMSVTKAIEQVRATHHMCRANARISGHYSNHIGKYHFRSCRLRGLVEIKLESERGMSVILILIVFRTMAA